MRLTVRHQKCFLIPSATKSTPFHCVVKFRLRSHLRELIVMSTTPEEVNIHSHSMLLFNLLQYSPYIYSLSGCVAPSPQVTSP